MKLPRVAAVHDMSGFGKCSLTVALPVISACGVEVCPLPTAMLSTNTNFEGFTIFDFTAEMAPYMAHWKKIDLKIDALYSGFLGSALQIEYIKQMAQEFAPNQVIIDPVMGDHGVIYKTYTAEMCENMRTLVGISNIVTPNLTEACTLTGQDYHTADTSYEGIRSLTEKIGSLGAKNVIITGIERGDKLYNCIWEEGRYSEREIDLLPYRMHGTGDLFTSVLTGGILTGHTLAQSVDSAAEFVYQVMQFSQGIEGVDERGACFEPLLHKLKSGVAEF